MRRCRFTAGTMIFAEGDASAEAYLLRHGRVEVLKGTTHGPLRLAVLGDGDVLGEMGLLDHRPRSASARALEDVEADAVNGREFMDMLSRDPLKSLQILRVLFERLRSLNTRLSAHSTPAAAATAIPQVTIVGLTPQASGALPAAGLDIGRFPFRIGRKPQADEPATLRFNNLEFSDTKPHLLSLHHFALDLEHNAVVVRDRGSEHGTTVNGARIGAGSVVDVAPLHPGENDVVAAVWQLPSARRTSPFRWRVLLQ